MELGALVSQYGVDWGELEKEATRDPFLNQIRDDLLAGKELHPGFELDGGRLKFKGRMVLPKISQFISSLLRVP